MRELWEYEEFRSTRAVFASRKEQRAGGGRGRGCPSMGDRFRRRCLSARCHLLPLPQSGAVDHSACNPRSLSILHLAIYKNAAASERTLSRWTCQRVAVPSRVIRRFSPSPLVPWADGITRASHAYRYMTAHALLRFS